MTATKVLITGLSGVGKSTVLEALRGRGWHAVDTDEDGLVDEHPDRTELRLPEILAILEQTRTDRPLVVAATGEGQSRLYPLVHHVVLLTAPWPVLEERLLSRAGNDFGKGPGELERIRADLEEHGPLLHRGPDLVLDTSQVTLAAVVDRIDGLAAAPTTTGADR